MTEPKCHICLDTGFWDYASFRIDPCPCRSPARAVPMHPDRRPVVNRRRHNLIAIHNSKKALRLMPLTSTRLTPKVRSVVTKKVAMRISSRYESSRPARPVLRSAFFYGRAHWEAFGPAGNGFFHRSANPVLPDLQNSSWSKGVLARTKPLDPIAFLSGPAPTSHQQTRLAPLRGGARV